MQLAAASELLCILGRKHAGGVSGAHRADVELRRTPPRRDALRRDGLLVENCAYGQRYDQCVESTDAGEEAGLDWCPTLGRSGK
jgi:hypothetical protein